MTAITSKPDDGTVADRARRIATITAHLRPHRLTDAHLVVIEGPAFSRQGQTGVHLRAGLWWRIVGQLHTAGVPVAEVSPTALKRYATGLEWGPDHAHSPTIMVAITDEHGRAGVRVLVDLPELGIAAGSEFLCGECAAGAVSA